MSDQKHSCPNCGYVDPAITAFNPLHNRAEAAPENTNDAEAKSPAVVIVEQEHKDGDPATGNPPSES